MKTIGEMLTTAAIIRSKRDTAAMLEAEGKELSRLLVEDMYAADVRRMDGNGLRVSLAQFNMYTDPEDVEALKVKYEAARTESRKSGRSTNAPFDSVRIVATDKE